jgi:hypothetical protein
MNKDDLFRPVAEVAKEAGLSGWTVYNYARRGLVECSISHGEKSVRCVRLSDVLRAKEVIRAHRGWQPSGAPADTESVDPTDIARQLFRTIEALLEENGSLKEENQQLREITKPVQIPMSVRGAMQKYGARV